VVTRFHKSLLVGAGIIFCSLAIVSQSSSHFRHYGISDWLAWIDTVGEHPETHYALGFSEQSFSKVKPGMTTNEVLHILGEPLSRTPWDLWGPSRLGQCWDYSESTTNIMNFHMRDIIFNPDCTVEYIGREYYSEEYESGF
jgi:hypothetical protein